MELGETTEDCRLQKCQKHDYLPLAIYSINIEMTELIYETVINSFQKILVKTVSFSTNPFLYS